MRNIIKLGFACLLVSGAISAHKATAQETPALKPLAAAQMQGMYGGTFLCSSGEMGMTLSLNDIGPVMMTGGKSLDANKRLVSGVLNFFPTVGNPDAPKGVFEVGGTAHTYKHFTKVKLTPGKWLDKPENFGASGLEGMISNKGHFSGKPTASGCHSLDMTKLRTQ